MFFKPLIIILTNYMQFQTASLISVIEFLLTIQCLLLWLILSTFFIQFTACERQQRNRAARWKSKCARFQHWCRKRWWIYRRYSWACYSIICPCQSRSLQPHSRLDSRNQNKLNAEILDINFLTLQRIAQTSERVVNFKARLITSLI